LSGFGGLKLIYLKMDYDKKSKEKGRPENFKATFRHKNGSVVYGLMSASLMEIEPGTEGVT
jgi:hypothetical protein